MCKQCGDKQTQDEKNALIVEMIAELMLWNNYEFQLESGTMYALG